MFGLTPMGHDISQFKQFRQIMPDEVSHTWCFPNCWDKVLKKLLTKRSEIWQHARHEEQAIEEVNEWRKDVPYLAMNMIDVWKACATQYHTKQRENASGNKTSRQTSSKRS